MKKVSLIHCYSDENRGDAGIIIATIQLIRSLTKSEINLHSTFSFKDERFRGSHFSTKKWADQVFPSIFPEPFIQDGEQSKKNNLRKLVNFFKFSLRGTLLLVFPGKSFMWRWAFGARELDSIYSFLDSDLIISKGGSFLYSFGGISGFLFFLRMIFPIILAIRLNKKVVIFSQSLGPFSTKLRRKIAEVVVSKVDSVYLRESECLKYLKIDSKTDLKVIPDAAFYLKPSTIPTSSQVKSCVNQISIGVTVRPYESDGDQSSLYYSRYINAIAAALVNFSRQRKLEIYVFSQVTGPSEHEDDRLASRLLIDSLKEHGLTEKVILHETVDDPCDLKAIYSQMDLMICTRLHSAIFALAMQVPVINISYHGTKSEGIMRMIGCEDYVLAIDKLSEEILTQKLNDIVSRRNEIRGILKNRIETFQNELCSSMKEVLSDS